MPSHPAIQPFSQLKTRDTLCAQQRKKLPNNGDEIIPFNNIRQMATDDN